MRVNKKTLADIMGVSERSLTEWQENEGLPIATKGLRGQENVYDTEAVIAWQVSRALAKAGKTESQRDREARLRGDKLELELAKERGTLVPADQVGPIWESRVLAAAGFMASRQSRLASILEATPGEAAKREVLKREDADFLNKLGVDGERMQAVVDAVMKKLAAADLSAFLRDLGGQDNDQLSRKPASPEPPPGSVGEAGPTEEGSPE